MICNKADTGMESMERIKKLQNLLAINEFSISDILDAVSRIKIHIFRILKTAQIL